MDIIQNIFAFLFAIFLLVTVHEWAHFWVARHLGIKTLRFSIGFGRPVWRWYGKDGTEYVIAWLPLGGYVKLLDSRETVVSAAEKHLEFNQKPVWARALVIIAGPLTNWLLAILLFTVVFWVGLEQHKPIIGEVIPGSIAAQAGLKPHDQIIKIENKAVVSWSQVVVPIILKIGEKGELPIYALSGSSQPQLFRLNINHWVINDLNPDPLKSLGIEPYQPPAPPILAAVESGSAAARAGLKIGDRIMAIAGETVNDWKPVLAYIQAHPDQATTMTIQRNNQLQRVEIKIGHKLGPGLRTIGFLGAEIKRVPFPADQKILRKYPGIHGITAGFQESNHFIAFNAELIFKMIRGQLSMQSLGGPISIFASAQRAFKQGVLVYMTFLAFISALLAFINILPIPGLDGGHLLFLSIEAIRRRPISPAVQLLFLRFGMIFLVVLMFRATVNDLLRLFSN